ncbi:MAG: immunity 17 family protein [Lysobacteraceae bacterium]
MMTILIAIFAGAFCIVAAFLDWDWFFNNWRARLFVNLFGRNGARVVYALMGVGLIVVGMALKAAHLAVR